MKNYVPVKGEPDFVRDMETGAIININQSSIHRKLEQNKLKRKQFDESNKLKEKVDKLETDMSDIKSLLETIVKRL